MFPWNATLLLGPHAVRLLLTSANGDELLKARLPLRALHPRAASSLLDGLALWAEHPLTVAIAADGSCAHTFVSWVFGPDRWPTDSALLRFLPLATDRRRRTLPGVGDFRQLRRAYRTGRSA
jgi:hypothetical protein